MKYQFQIKAAWRLRGLIPLNALADCIISISLSAEQLHQAAQEPVFICPDHRIQGFVGVVAELADIVDGIREGLYCLVPLVPFNLDQLL